MKYLATLSPKTLLSILLIVGLAFSGCRTHYNSSLEPTASDLSAIKDSYYYLLAAPISSSPSENYLGFYVCHIFQESAPPAVPSESQYCVNAFASQDGEEFSIPKAMIMHGTASGAIARKGAEVERLGAFTRNATLITLTAILVTPAVFAGIGAWGHLKSMSKMSDLSKLAQQSLLFLGLSTPANMFVYHGINPPTSSHLDPHIDSTYMDPELLGEIAERSTARDGTVDYDKIHNFIREHNVKNPRDRLQMVITGTNRKEAGKFFKNLTQHLKNEKTEFTPAKIPEMLPILGYMIRDMKWATDTQLAQHCLPRRDEGYSRMCKTLKQWWPTSNSPLNYIKP
ncbi:MAG: hypothetical protein OXC44_06845 [Proteobacteria bacterium]|nr:hypothetical protein [Pseudomonadota bacterium]